MSKRTIEICQILPMMKYISNRRSVRYEVLEPRDLLAVLNLPAAGQDAEYKIALNETTNRIEVSDVVNGSIIGSYDNVPDLSLEIHGNDEINESILICDDDQINGKALFEFYLGENDADIVSFVGDDPQAYTNFYPRIDNGDQYNDVQVVSRNGVTNRLFVRIQLKVFETDQLKLSSLESVAINPTQFDEDSDYYRFAQSVNRDGMVMNSQIDGMLITPIVFRNVGAIHVDGSQGSSLHINQQFDFGVDVLSFEAFTPENTKTFAKQMSVNTNDPKVKIFANVDDLFLRTSRTLIFRGQVIKRLNQDIETGYGTRINVRGTSDANHFDASLSTNPVALYGLGGDDYLAGGSKDDFINGGGGNDTIRGNGGNDILYGGPGNDQLSGGAADDRLIGGAGDDFARGQNGDDTLYGGSGDDELTGMAGNDVVRGGLGHDILLGGVGNDRLTGDAGRDTLKGGNGDDRLNGGAGWDTLLGGRGNDVVFGGLNRDLFKYIGSFLDEHIQVNMVNSTTIEVARSILPHSADIVETDTYKFDKWDYLRVVGYFGDDEIRVDSGTAIGGTIHDKHGINSCVGPSSWRIIC